VSTVVPISVNKLFGLGDDFNILDPKPAFNPLTPLTTPAKPDLEEALNNHYNATSETKLVGDQLPPPVSQTPETIQAGRTTLSKAGDLPIAAAKLADTGVGYLNQAIRGHTKFLTDVGEGMFGAATGLVTGAASMALSASDVLNTYAARTAREGPFAGSPFVEPTQATQRASMPDVFATPAEQSPTHFRDIFKRSEEATKGWSYEPKSETGKKTLELINTVPHAIKATSDFIADQATKIGMDPDKARLLSFGMELVLFYGLDKGVRAAAPELRSRVSDLRTKVRNARTDGELLSAPVLESATRLAESVNRYPEAGPALDAARARLVETLRRPITDLTTTLREPVTQLTDTLRTRAEEPVTGLADVLRRRQEQLGAAPGDSVRAPEVAAAAPREVAPAPALGDVSVAAAAPERMQPASDAASNYGLGYREVTADGRGSARHLYNNAMSPEAPKSVQTSALGELKSIAREGLRNNESTRIGLERLGFSPEEITAVEPRLRQVRATKSAESVPATSASTQIPAGVETPVSAVRGELDFGGMFSDLAGAIGGSFKDMLWDQYGKGSVQNTARVPELSLQVAKALKDAGIDIPRSRFDSMITEIEKIRAIASEQGLRGEAFRQPVAEYYNNLKRELEEGKRITTEVAKPDVQLTQTPEGELSYVKPTGEVVAKATELPAQVELARAAPGETVTLPPAPGIVDTAPVLEKPKRQRKIVKAKEESPVTAQDTVAGIAADAGVELGPTPARSSAVSYYPVRSMTELGERLGNAIPEAGTIAPERAAIQVRTNTVGAKPDALFLDTTGLNTLTTLAEIEKQISRGRMSRETGEAMIANLRRQAEIGDTTLANAHEYNGQRLQREATLMADMLGIDLYVKKGKNYEQVPRDVVAADAKLNRGDVTTPSGVTKDEAAALADFRSAPIGPEQLKEIIDSSEKGIDISNSLPSELAPHYRTLLEAERQGINLSERRNFIDILKDVNTLLGESGAIGGRGPFNFNRERRMAAQRLEADARRIGSGFTDLFRRTLPPEQIPMFERYLEGISNPEPPKGVGPQRMSLDPDAIARGDQVVKHRVNTEGIPQGPPLWESDVIPIYDAANPGRSTFRGLEVPIYLMERMGLKDPIYYAYRTAQNEYNLALNAMRKDLKSMTKYFSPSSRERIGAYAYSTTPEGMRLLERAKTEVPTLNPAEMRAYNEMRGIYEDFYNRINEVREATGHEPLIKVDNYFTMARSFSVMERLGIVPDMLRHPPADINAQFTNHSITPFPHARLRSGSTYAAEFDAFRLMDRYASSSLKQIHIAPFISKLNELIETKLPDPTQTSKPWAERDVNWSLKEQNANAYNVLHSWKEYLATGTNQYKLPQKVENFITVVGNNLAYSLLSANLRSAGVQISTMRNTFQSLGYIPTVEGVTRSIGDIAAGGERWKRALDKSEILSGRRYQDAFSGMEFSLTGFRPRELVGAITRGRFTEIQGAAAGAGMKFLEVMDMVSANVSWNAAYDHATKALRKTDREAIRIADDLVVKTQGSTMPGDLAGIQRSVAGKALTQFQTFLISDWNFLQREVLGLKDPKMTWGDTAMNAARFVGTTAAFNVLFENVLNVQSPFPTFVKDAKSAIADNDSDPLKIAWRLASGILEPIPVIGASRYGKSIAGPAVEVGRDFTRGLAGSPLAPSPYESLAKMAGIPGTQQIAKTLRARNRGEGWYNSITGWYSEDTGTRRERGGRRARD